MCQLGLDNFTSPATISHPLSDGGDDSAGSRSTRISFLSTPGQPGVLRFQRRLAHPVRRVWRALTDEGELAVWYATRMRIEQRAGGKVSFAFPGGEPFEGEVLLVEEPRTLAYTTLGDVLRWQLTADVEGTSLRLDNRLGELPHAPYTAAGFHITLNQLATMLDDGPAAVHRQEMPPPDDLVDHYRRALARTGWPAEVVPSAPSPEAS